MEAETVVEEGEEETAVAVDGDDDDALVVVENETLWSVEGCRRWHIGVALIRLTEMVAVCSLDACDSRCMMRQWMGEGTATDETRATAAAAA